MNDQRIFSDDAEQARMERAPSRADADFEQEALTKPAGLDAATAKLAQEDLHWRCEFAWKVFAQNQSVITATDQKTYMLIVMSTLLVSLGSANIDRFIVSSLGRQIALSLLVASAVMFFLLALATLFARVIHKPVAGKRSLVYFVHVARDGQNGNYHAKFSTAPQAEMLDDLLDQLVQVAQVLTKKLVSYRRCWMGAIVEVAVFLSIVLVGHLID
jgi:hypothetical protein